LTKPKILVVEDFEDSRSALRQLLESNGFQILEANDGEQAVEAALRESPDLILMDLTLPRVDGLEATRQIRTRRSAQALPIIIISAYDAAEVRAEALAAGGTAYLSKPIDFDELEKIIGKYLPVDQGLRPQVARV
jgi:two-component system cell cycle response regulator DivK